MTGRQICLFTETYHPVVGGGETQARLLAEGLVARGYRVSVITRRSDGALPKVERHGEITVYRLRPVGAGQLKKWGLAISSIPVLLRLRHQWDLVFVSGFRIIGMTAVLMSRLLGKKSVLKADSQGEMSGAFFKPGLAKYGMTPRVLPFRLFLAFRNWILRWADSHVAITPDVSAELAAAGVQPDVVHMIPNSVNTSRFHPVSAAERATLRDRLGLELIGKIVVYTGRMVSYKGLPLLLKVWREIQGSHEGMKLVLVGTGGLDIHNCEDELREYVRSTDMERSVLFTGSVSNVPEYLQAADIFAFPSENDAFPSSLVEAMACRLAVVSTPVGAIPTVVEDGVNGLLVTPGSFDELYRALDRLITDPALAQQLGAAARHTVEQRYTADLVTRRYSELFEVTLASRAS